MCYFIGKTIHSTLLTLGFGLANFSKFCHYTCESCDQGGEMKERRPFQLHLGVEQFKLDKGLRVSLSYGNLLKSAQI